MRDPGQYALSPGASVRLSEYDSGLLSNLKEAFGQRVWLWLWPGLGDGCCNRSRGASVRGEEDGVPSKGERWIGELLCVGVCMSRRVCLVLSRLFWTLAIPTFGTFVWTHTRESQRRKTTRDLIFYMALTLLADYWSRCFHLSGQKQKQTKEAMVCVYRYTAFISACSPGRRA